MASASRARRAANHAVGIIRRVPHSERASAERTGRAGRSALAPARRVITVAIIPARAGSKGVPGKNRKRIGGASLVQIAIAAAEKSGVCELCVVSSDDPVLLAQARRAAVVAIERPKRMATDRSRTIDAIRHAVDAIERASAVRCDPIIVLEPTAPLRQPKDIRAALKLNLAPERPTVVSASYVQDTDWLFRLGAGAKVEWVRTGAKGARRQDQEKLYVPNGVVYVLTRRRLEGLWLEPAVAYLTPPERSADIDDAHDLWLVRALASVGTSRRRRGNR